MPGSTPAAATLLAASGVLGLPAEVVGVTIALAGLATFVLPSQAMANLVTYETGFYGSRDLLWVDLWSSSNSGGLWWKHLGFLE